MIPIDVKIESQLHAGFTEFYLRANTEMLASQLLKYHQAGHRFKMIEVLKGEVNEVIKTAELPEPLDPDCDDYGPFIRAEKLAALRLLDFNAAAELARIEKILDNPNPKTTRPSAKPPAIHPVMYYCVFIKGKDIFIILDTNYKQYHWELRRLFKSFRSRRENND